jgi:tetratricopeptide (TPR) repeat protein
LVGGEIERNRTVARQGSAPTSAQDFVDLAESLSITDRVARAREQRRLADAAIKLDPKFARAWVVRAETSVELFWNDLSSDPAPMVADADADSARAVILDDKDPMAWVARGNALRMRGDMTAAMTSLDRAQEVDPTRLTVQLVRGFFYLDVGRPEETLKVVVKLRPIFGAQQWALAFQACAAHLLLGSYEMAIPECERAGTTADDGNALANLTAAYAMSGQLEKAAQTKARLLKVMPGFTIARYEQRFHPPLPPAAVALDKTHFVAGLRKAGVPEGR